MVQPTLSTARHMATVFGILLMTTHQLATAANVSEPAEKSDKAFDQEQAIVQSFLEDSTITALIKADLIRDNGLSALAISVETHRGQVIMSGFVDNDQQIKRAGEIALGVRGVLGVKNSLLVKS
jgi:hyperosmotically inducible protein